DSFIVSLDCVDWHSHRVDLIKVIWVADIQDSFLVGRVHFSFRFSGRRQGTQINDRRPHRYLLVSGAGALYEGGHARRFSVAGHGCWFCLWDCWWLFDWFCHIVSLLAAGNVVPTMSCRMPI